MRSLILLALVAVFLSPVLSADDASSKSKLDKKGLTFETKGFSFNLHTSVQFRLTYHDVRGEGTDGDNGRDFANFSFPGVRTFMHGHFIDRQFQYRLWLVWSWPSGGVRIEDAFFKWAPVPFFNVTVGQHRVPASWEYLVDHEKTAFTDRAIADQAFKQGWGKGVSISGSVGMYDVGEFDEGTLWWQVGVFNGAISSPDGSQGRGQLGPNGVTVTDADRTDNFKGGFRNNDWRINSETFGQLIDSEMMVAARIEFHPMGVLIRHMAGLGESTDIDDWKMMIGLAANWMSARVDGVGTFLGAIYHTDRNLSAIPPTASGRLRVQTSIFHATLDGHFRWLGLSVNWALHYRTAAFNSTGALDQRNVDDDPRQPQQVTDTAATVDIGYFILDDELSIQTRFSIVNFDEFQSVTLAGVPVDGDSFGTDASEYGGGVTWYLHGDNLKLSAEYRYVVQQLPHGNGPAADGERTSDYRTFQEIRLQLQWIF